MDHLNEIDRIFKKYTSNYHFYLRDLVNNKTYELGVKKSYPICSCFKIAALMCLYDSLNSEHQLFEEIVITPTDFSLGSGVISTFSRPVKFTLLQLAQVMMSHSDGTATDIIIKKVGIENINTFLREHCPNSAVINNQREMIQDFMNRFSIDSLKSNSSLVENDFPDFTNAEELAILAEAGQNFVPKNISRELYLEAYRVKRATPRTSLFYPHSVEVEGKTGSLGYAYFANDCGAIRLGNQVVAYFGITSQGFRVDKDMVDQIFGLAGLSILSFLKISYQANPRFCSSVREVIG